MPGSGNVEDWSYDPDKDKQVDVIIETKTIQLKDMSIEDIDRIISILTLQKNVIIMKKELQRGIEEYSNEKSKDINEEKGTYNV